QVRDTLLIAHIATVDEDIYVVAGQLLGNAAQLSFVPATDDELAALIRQGPRNRQSDALGCAGDQCDFLLEEQEEILTAESAKKNQQDDGGTSERFCQQPTTNSQRLVFHTPFDRCRISDRNSVRVSCSSRKQPSM